MMGRLRRNERLVNALKKMGSTFCSDHFAKAMESVSSAQDIFGIPAMQYSAQMQLGSHTLKLVRIQDGRWTVSVPVTATKPS